MAPSLRCAEQTLACKHSLWPAAAARLPAAARQALAAPRRSLSHRAGLPSPRWTFLRRQSRQPAAAAFPRACRAGPFKPPAGSGAATTFPPHVLLGCTSASSEPPSYPRGACSCISMPSGRPWSSAAAAQPAHWRAQWPALLHASYRACSTQCGRWMSTCTLGELPLGARLCSPLLWLAQGPLLQSTGRAWTLCPATVQAAPQVLLQPRFADRAALQASRVEHPHGSLPHAGCASSTAPTSSRLREACRSFPLPSPRRAPSPPP